MQSLTIKPDASQTGRIRAETSPWLEPGRSGAVPRGRADVAGAVAAWRQLLGAEHAFDDPASTARYGRTTLVQGHAPVAVVRPGNTAEVQSVVQIARQHAVPVYPISRGKNWGYGDACPTGAGHALIDLGRMKRIVEVNEPLAYAVIEPGVTQGQLCDYLLRHHPSVYPDSTGAGPDASVVGNIAERGFGHTAYGDHYGHSCGMEIVLPDGRLLRTGFGHYENAAAKHLYKWGIGPSLDGLFTQSNLGIITRVCVWLMPRPERMDVFVLSVPGEQAIVPLVEALRGLRLDGTLKSVVHIGNDLRIVSSLQRYPWREADGVTPLPEDVRSRLRKRWRVGAWNVSGSLQGSPDQVKAARRRLKRALRGIGRVQFFNERKLGALGRLVNVCRRLGLARRSTQRFEMLRAAHALLAGSPTEAFLPGTLWRCRTAEDLLGDGAAAEQKRPGKDPLDCHAGLMWLAPVLPATGEAAESFTGLIGPILTQYGFESFITYSLITERAMTAVTNISFDKRDAGESARASACYDKLSETLLAAGYLPYRTSVASMQRLARGSTVFWDVVAAIKRALDPADTLAPGRYLPAAATAAPAAPRALSSVPEYRATAPAVGYAGGTCRHANNQTLPGESI